jgi:uncharacterized protein
VSFWAPFFVEICLMHKYTNPLIDETSPYLLQHAHNPVQWHPWGSEALKKAREHNKPILVSIGYSACHWCHVMEKESFENEETAKLMNEHFINIKIDREERPDLDHIYMDAVQAMTGSGGWPLNVFLTPDAKPFFGGTYFPPTAAYNRQSWTDTLLGVVQAFKKRRHEIDAQAENLTSHLLQANSFGIQKIDEKEIFQQRKITEAVSNLLKTADKEWGGFGRAPKFPQTYSIQFLLRYASTSNFFKKKSLELLNSQESLDQSGFKVPPPEGFREALLSLDKMIQGGIYDQIGGGFARYATDTEWLVPHFEKMLYDNALLTGVLSEAYQATGKQRYKEVIEETISFVERELLSPEGGFYAALDADSEGVEGKYYVWTKNEVQVLLDKEAVIFCLYYDISEQGNWEGHNIPWVKKEADVFCKDNAIDAAIFKHTILQSQQILLAAREKRIRPSLDDKIILGWNALMNTACAKAYAATGNERYRQLAIKNMAFMLQKFEQADGFHHTYKNEVARYPAFLDDYAYLIQALIHLHEITANTNWLVKAKELTEKVQLNFREEDTPFFYYTAVQQTDVIVRKKEVYDGAQPSGNSVMAYNLWQLAIFFNIQAWRQQSLDMLASLGNAITRYPSSFANWACLLQEVVAGTSEIVVTGNNFAHLCDEILAKYIPHKVLMGAQRPIKDFPLFAEKELAGKTAIYCCRNYTCQQPVFSAAGLITLINNA